MKFAHIADCHLGSWRQPEMRSLNLEAFKQAINKCIFEQVDFILIAGDFFDTAIPSIEILKDVADKLRELKEKNISCYVIPGSHDYSISGKNIISVFDKAGLCIDLSQKKEFIHNNILFYGVAGRKGSLEQEKIIELKDYFEKLKNKISLLKKEKNIHSILLLHTTVSELLPNKLNKLNKGIKSLTMRDLPSGFDYYALGHVHSANIFEKEEKTAAYTGALFPCDFSELEQQHTANFLIIEKDDNDKESRITKKNIKKISLNLKKIINLNIDANEETIFSLNQKILEEFKKYDLKDAIVTIRIHGVLKEGKPSELDFISIEEKLLSLEVYCVLKNTNKFSSKEFEIKIEDIETKSIEDIERDSLARALKEGIITQKNKDKFLSFVRIFNIEKNEGEKSFDFSSRLTKETVKTLKLDKLWD